jgi:hypothetical protein
MAKSKKHHSRPHYGAGYTVSDFRRKVTELTPAIFASFIIALHRLYGFGIGRLSTVLEETNKIWHESVNSGIDIVYLCKLETGIDILSSVTAKEAGIDSDDCSVV